MRITTSVLEGVPKLLNSWPGISGSYETAGTIQLTVRPLTPTESAALGLDTNERKQKEELNRLALEWATLAHLESNFLKPEYQQNFAAKHASKILGTLNCEWLEAYQHVLGDPELYAIIQDQHPHVLDFMEARLEVIRIAERLAVEPAPEPKPKVTPDEWRARIERYRQRFLTRKRVKVEDYKADMMQALMSTLQNSCGAAYVPPTRHRRGACPQFQASPPLGLDGRSGGCQSGRRWGPLAKPTGVSQAQGEYDEVRTKFCGRPGSPCHA